MKKIHECLLFLCDFFKNSEKLADVDYPENILYGSDEWLYYIFYSCLLDYGMKSKIYHQNLIYTYYKYPELFNPKVVVEKYEGNSNDLLIILKENVHSRYPNVALKKWISLSHDLVNYISLKDTLVSLGSFDELYSFIRKIKGYGQKTGGLLLRLISDSRICDFKDEMSSIPLDRHDMEICYKNGIINKSKLTEKEIEELSSLLIEVGKKLDLAPSLVDKYLWEIGNQFCNRKDCLNCPLGEICKKK